MVFSLNLPLTLTLIRLIIAPCFLPFLIVSLAPYNTYVSNSILAMVFLFFGMTDFFDGYLARKLQQVTVLGTILDPLADKFLMYSALVALLTVGKISYCWVLLFIGREFFVMGLRQITLEQHCSLPVSYCAKLKTTFQFLYIAVTLLNPYQSYGLSGAPYWNGSEMCLLLCALATSLVSAWHYYHEVLTKYVMQEQ